MKSRLNIFLMLALLSLTQICHPARSSQSGSSARGGASTPTIIPSTAVKSLPGGQNVATSLSTLSANVAAKKPSGPVQVQTALSERAQSATPSIATSANIVPGTVQTAMKAVATQKESDFDLYQATEGTIGQILSKIKMGATNNKNKYLIPDTGRALSDASKMLIDTHQDTLIQIGPVSNVIAANMAAKIPAGPLLDKYLKNLRCVQAKSFLEAIAASPETQLFDNAGTPVRELYINDPNPDAYTEISTPKTSSQQTLQNTSKIAPVKPAVTISNSNRGGTRAR